MDVYISFDFDPLRRLMQHVHMLLQSLYKCDCCTNNFSFFLSFFFVE